MSLNVQSWCNVYNNYYYYHFFISFVLHINYRKKTSCQNNYILFSSYVINYMIVVKIR